MIDRVCLPRLCGMRIDHDPTGMKSVRANPASQIGRVQWTKRCFVGFRSSQSWQPKGHRERIRLAAKYYSSDHQPPMAACVWGWASRMTLATGFAKAPGSAQSDLHRSAGKNIIFSFFLDTA